MAKLNTGKIIKGLEGLTAQAGSPSFFLGFLKAFGFPKSTIQKLESNDRTRNIGLQDGDIGLTKQIYFRQVTDQDPAEALEALLAAPELEKHRIRFFIVTDFKRLAAYDSRVDDSIDIDFPDLAGNFDFFLPLTGQYEKPLAYTAHPADTKACERMGKLYDVIRVLNRYDAEDLHGLNVFLTRLLFCFFAEDTGIFPTPGQMTVALQSMTAKDGSDLPLFFEQLFTALDLPEDAPERKALPATIQAFPYVNGGLFTE